MECINFQWGENWYNYDEHAFFWKLGFGIIDIDKDSLRESWAYDINNKSQVIGTLYYGESVQIDEGSFLTVRHAFIWTDETGLIDLGTFGGDAVYPKAINDIGQIAADLYFVSDNDVVVKAVLLSPYIQIKIDIIPRSENNCININDHGVIPVAIIGATDFDVSQVDPATCFLEGMGVKVVGKKRKYLAHIKDINSDGYDDLLLMIEDKDGYFIEGQTEATLIGNLYGGTPLEGSDNICILPKKKNQNEIRAQGLRSVWIMRLSF